MTNRRMFTRNALLLSTGLLGSTIAGCQLQPGRPFRQSTGRTMQQNIQHWLTGWDNIAGHRTGTAGDSDTAQWLSDEIRDLGLSSSVDWFEFERRHLEDCALYWQENGAEQRLSGVPLFDGGFTNSTGITGELSTDIEGTGLVLTDYAPYDSHPATKVLNSARRTNRAQGIVAVARDDLVAPGLTLLNADHYNQPFGPPVLQVSTQRRALLNELLSNHVPVRLVVNAPTENTRAGNVQLKISGRDSSLAPVVIMTPRSAWYTSTSERGGGIAAWLACVNHFAQHKPLRNVVFTANTGHELGHIGFKHFIKQQPQLIKDAHVWFHLGANFAAKNAKVRFQASSERLLRQGTQKMTDAGVAPDTVTTLGQEPYGEARDVYRGGGAYVSLLADNPLFHHPDDRWPSAVDLNKTNTLVQLIVTMAADLANA